MCYVSEASMNSPARSPEARTSTSKLDVEIEYAAALSWLFWFASVPFAPGVTYADLLPLVSVVTTRD